MIHIPWMLPVAVAKKEDLKPLLERPFGIVTLPLAAYVTMVFGVKKWRFHGSAPQDEFQGNSTIVDFDDLVEILDNDGGDSFPAKREIDIVRNVTSTSENPWFSSKSIEKSPYTAFYGIFPRWTKKAGLAPGDPRSFIANDGKTIHCPIDLTINPVGAEAYTNFKDLDTNKEFSMKLKICGQTYLVPMLSPTPNRPDPDITMEPAEYWSYGGRWNTSTGAQA